MISRRVMCLAIRAIVLVLSIIADSIDCNDKDGLHLHPL